MKEVTKEEFYKVIGPLNVVLSTLGKFPFTTEFKMRTGKLIGKSVDSHGTKEDEDYIITKYYLTTV